MTVTQSVGVLGAGSWGTALAVQLARGGYPTWLWGRGQAAMQALAAERCNTRYLPGVAFPDGLRAVSDLAAHAGEARLLLVAVPSEGFRAMLRLLADCARTPRLLWATKGLETHTGALLHEVLADELGPQVPGGVLSGPSFAGDVARGLPCAVTLASFDAELAADAARMLHGDSFRVYTSDDVIGVQLGGALKNVLAIAAGISDGLGFGASARAALMTRGLAEIMRLGERAGARRRTLTGLSGMGDLVLTCTDDQSRNRRLGLALAAGKTLEEARLEIGQAIEGAATARVVRHMASARGVEMPICEQVYQVLYAQREPRGAVAELLARDIKSETP